MVFAEERPHIVALNRKIAIAGTEKRNLCSERAETGTAARAAVPAVTAAIDRAGGDRPVSRATRIRLASGIAATVGEARRRRRRIATVEFHPFFTGRLEQCVWNNAILVAVEFKHSNVLLRLAGSHNTAGAVNNGSEDI